MMVVYYVYGNIFTMGQEGNENCLGGWDDTSQKLCCLYEKKKKKGKLPCLGTESVNTVTSYVPTRITYGFINLRYYFSQDRQTEWGCSQHDVFW